jgi:hypothetical protein
VEFAGLPADLDFHPGNEPEAEGFGPFRRFPNAGNGIVVGQGYRRKAPFSGKFDQLGGAQAPVGSG